MHRTKLRWLQTVTALLLVAMPLLASDGSDNRQSLKGITALDVLIENLRPSEIADGLTKDQLQTDVEMRLRKAGVTVVKDVNAPYLYINVNLFKDPNGLYSYHFAVEFSQTVVTVSNQTSLSVPTWSVGQVGTVGRQKMSGAVRAIVGDMVDEFLSAYFSANPK